MARWLSEVGHDAVHTLDLPAGNRTTDAEITRYADDDGRVVITKDADFVDGHLLHGRPQRLLLISTGNIVNPELEHIFRSSITQIADEFTHNNFVEVGRDGLTVRG